MKKLWIVCGGFLCAASFFVGQVVAQEGGDKPAGFPMPAWIQKSSSHVMGTLRES